MSNTQADLTERARELLSHLSYAVSELPHVIKAERETAAAEARRAAIAAARSCAQFKCTMMSDEIPRCPDCGATVEGNDPVNGVCQADVIRQIKADVIEAYFIRALASPPAPQEETR